uniref:Uncharacterized protein n=1 Tax=Alexandrium catenella TaxID=2925 RepID=A0A7S1QIM3_ALECA|mmetsp:Transcript_33004/g.89358  ORF Transcript_33004/g.89358 Transcript_33004/m.89358 type:complete len:303 (+) Transcript_33004:69-977(+)
MADEEILKKKGPELFKELLRVYSTGELEDYFKAGIWKEELMKADLQLIWAHRREAGAPDPPDLEDVKMPEIPKFATMGGMMGVRPFAPGGVVPGIVRPGGLITVRPPIIAPKAGLIVPGAVANGATTGPAAELKLIALFIAKWKLDPTKTKMLLARMNPAKRRYVITNFKNATNAADSTGALEQYIAQCEKTNAWGAAVAAAGFATPAPAGAVTPRPVVPKPFAVLPVAAGVKRPIAPIAPVVDPSKRPRMQGVTPPTAKPMGVRPPGIQPVAPRAAIRPVTPGAKAQEKPGNLIRSLLQKL